MGDASGQLGCTVFEKLIDESSDYVPRGGTIVDYDDEHYTVLRVGHAGPEFLQLARGGCQPVEPMPNRRSIKALIKAVCKHEAGAAHPNARMLRTCAELAEMV
jgi:hypothetical protein